MGLFSIKKRLVSKEPVNVWSTGDVSAWAKVMDLPKACRTALKPVDGERLLNSTPQELQKLVDGHVRPEQLQLLIQHVNKLKVENGFAPTFDAPERQQSFLMRASAAGMHRENASFNSQQHAPPQPARHDPNVMVLIQDHAPRAASLENSAAISYAASGGGVNAQQPRPFGAATGKAPPKRSDHSDPNINAAMQNIAIRNGNTTDGPIADASLSSQAAAQQAQQQVSQAGNRGGANAQTTPLSDDADAHDSYVLASSEPPELELTPHAARSDFSDHTQVGHAQDTATESAATQANADTVAPAEQLGGAGGVGGAPSGFAHGAFAHGGFAHGGFAHGGVHGKDAQHALESGAPFGSIAQTASLSIQVDDLQNDGRPDSLRPPQSMRSSEQLDFLAIEMGGGITVRDLEAFLAPLERTRGLVDLVTGDHASAGLLSAIYRTYSDSFHAVPCAQNAAHLQDFCLAVMQVLETVGKRNATLGSKVISDVSALFNTASNLVNNFSTAGWFLHMAFMENIKGRFDDAHNAIVARLQAAHLATLPSGKALPLGDYKDPARAVRRVLKQLGSGSVANGIYKLIATESYRDKIATVMEVHKGDLINELDTVPHGDQAVDLSDLYNSLVAGKAEERVEAEDHEEHCKIFTWYDKGNKGHMDAADMKQVLTDLGLLETVRDKDQFVVTQMAMATRGDHRALTMDDFCTYYSSLVHLGERHQLRTKLGIEAENELKQQFQAFVNYGVRSNNQVELDGPRFAKYARDCQLLCKSLTSTDVDLIFARVKAKAARHIGFDTFLHALHMIAEKRGESFVELVTNVLRHESPVTMATRATTVRLHDDKSTYTGVYSRGGPTNLDLINSNDLRYLTDRSKADPRGVKLIPPSARMSLSRTPTSLHASHSTSRATYDGATPGSAAARSRALQTAPHPSSAAHSGGRMSLPGGGGGGASQFGVEATIVEARRSPGASKNGEFETVLSDQRVSVGSAAPRLSLRSGLLGEARQAFIAFALFGKRAEAHVKGKDVVMDGRAFAKLAKEAGLLDGKLDATRVDLTFAKCADKVSKRMTFKQFQEALADCARFKGDAPEHVIECVACCQGPLLQGTVQAESVRLHDDRRTYTGVYAQGGPTNVDHPTTLEGMVNRQAQEYANRREGALAPHRKAFA